jgi:hypothetical protein
MKSLLSSICFSDTWAKSNTFCASLLKLTCWMCLKSVGAPISSLLIRLRFPVEDFALETVVGGLGAGLLVSCFT